MQPGDFEEVECSRSDLAAWPDDEVEAVTVSVPLSLAGSRFDQALAELFPEHSRSRLSGLIKAGDILLDGVIVQPKTKLLGGEVITAKLRPRPEAVAFKPENVSLDVLYEDEALIVINKPPGLVVHPGAGNWDGTVLNGLLYRNPHVSNLPRAGIVHRLDKDTSGVMVAAKTEASQLALVRQLQARSMKRIYVALVRGYVGAKGGAGTVDMPIGRHPRERTRMAVVDIAQGGKPAVTHYRALEQFTYHTLVECRLETGRTHQIRVHMQSIGLPLEGDPVYGPPLSGLVAEMREAVGLFARQALHARCLKLIHPVSGVECSYESPVPADMRELIDVMSAF